MTQLAPSNARATNAETRAPLQQKRPLCWTFSLGTWVRRSRAVRSEMSDNQLVSLTVDALWLAVRLAAPALIAGWLAGLLAGLVQSATQVQEPVLSFVPKLLAVGGALALSATVLRERMLEFLQTVLVAVGR